MRRSTALAFALVTLALAAVLGGVGHGSVGGVDSDSVGTVAANATGSDDPALVSVGGVRFWPYVGADRSFDRRASSINVVVGADPSRVRRYLAGEEWNRTDRYRSDSGWFEPGDDDAAVADERVPWRDAPGAHRYTYVAGEGWTAERYQLHRGAYFGSRDHLRVYGPRGGNWTAVQAHAEHWDWFTVTHTVDSVEHAQRRVEAEFLGDPAFAVRRVYHGNGDTYDADGWTTVVVLALTPLVGRRRLRRLAARALNPDRIGLAASLAALPLVVRFGGILCEQYLPGLSSDAVVALWYPVLVGGVPVAAYGFGRRVPSTEAGALAALGLGTGVVLDYAFLGISVLPLAVAAHRAVAVGAVALLAAGAGSAAENATGSKGNATAAFRTGVVLWAVVVVAGHLV